ncbi:MAG: GNAT family N-acetyltransferase [Cyanobacteria bacterium REEB65]|nr:GNAT family N-acetyltransferase [Cyanobacteria bacterium REEB65]
MQIRPFAEGDREQVVALVQNMLLTHGLGWDPAGSDRDVTDPGAYGRDGGTFLVLEGGGKIFGTIAARRLESGSAELCRMYLHPAFWGEGWGSALLSALQGWAKAIGIGRIELETDPRFDRSIGFYEHKGFRRLPHPTGEWPLDAPLRYFQDL